MADPTVVGASTAGSNAEALTVGKPSEHADLAAEIREWLADSVGVCLEDQHESGCEALMYTATGCQEAENCTCDRAPAVRAVLAVLDGHQPGDSFADVCGECEFPWPCRTVRAIHAALIGGA